MIQKDNTAAQANMEDVLGIETKKLEDGTTIIKMGNNTYEFPQFTAPQVIYKAANK